jgi:hypothetical protein
MQRNFVSDPSNLGNILLKMGSVRIDKLKEAVVMQMDQQRDMRLGSVLMELGIITREDLDFALEVQRLFRKNKQTEATMLIMDYQLHRASESADRESILADASIGALDTEMEAMEELP